MKKFFGFMTLIALLFGVASCDRGPDPKPLPSGEGLSFTFKTPHDKFVTRAPMAGMISQTDEWRIMALDIWAVPIGGASPAAVLLEPETGAATIDTSVEDYLITPDPAAQDDEQQYTVTMTQQWIDANIGNKFTFYIVGNNATSDGLQVATFADEAALRDAVTASLAGGAPVTRPSDGTVNKNDNLLFSTVIPGIEIVGKSVMTGDLERRTARFDIDNTTFKEAGDNLFVLDEILVLNAPTAGPVFGTADPAAASVTGITADDYTAITDTEFNAVYDPLVGYAMSVFYTYPAVIKADGTGMQIVVNGTYMGQDVSLPVSTVEDREILANHRYILRLNPAFENFTLDESDWDYDDSTSDVIARPQKNTQLAALSVATAAAGGGGQFALPGTALYAGAPSTYGQFTAVGGGQAATVTIAAQPEYATTSYSIKYVEGGTRPADDPSDKITVTMTPKLVLPTTRAATDYQFTDNYTITVPAVADATKRTYIDAWVYIKSFDGPGGTDSIRVRRYAGGDASKILYLSGDKLAVGAWGAVTQANLLYFKFGSVVGVESGATTAWNDNGSMVRYNPTAGVTPTTWESVPFYAPSDYPAIMNVSDPETYNTVANVRAGKGDPCALVGYSAAEIAAMTDPELQAVLDAATWRLPTMMENVSVVGGPATPAATIIATSVFWKDKQLDSPNYNYASPSWTGNENTYPNGTANLTTYTFYTAGSPATAGFPIVAQGTVAAKAYSFPATGYRNATTGALTYVGTSGHYWSSVLSSATSGFSLYFTSSTVYPSSTYSRAYGFAVRCLSE
jgi:hypothetical protein